MKKSNKVEVQKGTIIANPPTMKQMPYAEKVRERDEEMKMLRSAKTMTLHKPKQGKK